MSYLVLRLVREWAVAQVKDNTIASEEYIDALKASIKHTSTVMKYYREREDDISNTEGGEGLVGG